MVTFTKQTKARDEDAIDAAASQMHAKGYNGDMVVYRNSVDVALCAIALAAEPLRKPFSRAVHPEGIFCVIGTKSHEDGQALRAKVAALRGMIAPAFVKE